MMDQGFLTALLFVLLSAEGWLKGAEGLTFRHKTGIATGHLGLAEGLKGFRQFPYTCARMYARVSHARVAAHTCRRTCVSRFAEPFSPSGMPKPLFQIHPMAEGSTQSTLQDPSAGSAEDARV